MNFRLRRQSLTSHGRGVPYTALATGSWDDPTWSHKPLRAPARSRRSFVRQTCFLIPYLLVLGIVILLSFQSSRPAASSTPEEGLTFDALLTNASDESEAEKMHPFTLPPGDFGNAAPFREYGHHFNYVTVRKDSIIPQPGIERLEGNPFNLAILRLPDGLEWQFIGVSRGPRNMIEEIVHKTNQKVFLQTLLGFGLNMSEDGRFEQASMATALHIPSRYIDNDCDNTWFRGPEDPRLYWSDANTPMMTFGMPSTIKGFCRGMWLAKDLRAIWPELNSIMMNARSVSPYRAVDQEGEIVELTFDETQGVEKNWMAFYPGPKPVKDVGFPLMHYSLYPDRILNEPARVHRMYNEQTPLYSYLMLEEDNDPEEAYCASHHHDLERGFVHGATPFSRLTLCNRGTCEPNESNTVFVAINHYIVDARNEFGRFYGRYFSFWNVTAPHRPIGIGPVFHLSVPDDTTVVYVLSLSFVPRTPPKGNLFQLQEAAERMMHDKKVKESSILYGPSHGFLDDRIFVGLGIQDSQLASIELKPEEMLSRLRGCDLSQVTFTYSQS